MAQRTPVCKECGWSCRSCVDHTTGSLHLHVEIENLKQRLLEREHDIVTMETNFLTEAEKFPNGEYAALTEELLTWQDKYSRLYESHKRVQKVNQSLEDKLLKIVDKCETEKNSLTREVSSLTQKLVESRDKISWLQDENERYRNDVNLAIQLLQCKPANFVSQKYDLLPSDLQQKVRSYVSSKRRPSDGNGVVTKPEMKTIKVPIPTFPPTAMVYSINKAPFDKEDNSEDKLSNCRPPVDIVSAAIMAKVLEERERERLQTKHCESCRCPTAFMEQGTQTDPPDTLYPKSVADSSNRSSQGLVRYVDVVTTRSSEAAGSNRPPLAVTRKQLHGNHINSTHIECFPFKQLENQHRKSIDIISDYKVNEANGRGSNMSPEGDGMSLGVRGKKSEGRVGKPRWGGGDRTEGSTILSDQHLLGAPRITNHTSCSNLNKPNIENQAKTKHQEGLRNLPCDIVNSSGSGPKNTDNSWVRSSGVTAEKKSLNENILSNKARVCGDKYKDKVGGVTEVCGPRPCSMRLQAGTSNILLDNATSYAPVLYRHSQQEAPEPRPVGRNGATVLVHVPRSRSASASSLDESAPNNGPHWTPTETEI